MHPYRSTTCDKLRPSNIGHDVRLAGWCNRIRDHGGLLFIDLRDHYGITQVVIDPSSPAFAVAETLRSEWVVRIDGTVQARPKDTVNAELPTGEIEVAIKSIEVLGRAEELPMPVFTPKGSAFAYPEEVRLKYRFLDLRREKPHQNIVLRSKVIQFLRRRMEDDGFMEFQTPILTASSPEGARDFLVPSRLHPGQFYALPQAPQQFKQLTMMSGFDRYFQIAPCFRDESARADRSPGEFYQLDIEMAFVEQEDVFRTVEPILRDLFRTFGGGKSVPSIFPHIPYKSALLRYGTDKPDLRNPLEIADITPVLKHPGMTLEPFRAPGSVGRIVVAPAASMANRSRKWFKDMEAWAITEKAKGLGYIQVVAPRDLSGPLA
ncbi:MAG: aspartate--tRNA ligase [Verrucomicrobiaceae bacterium]|nr:MAG: aspartate--tRNA ligase [Verrucomicrobiaceae bacterium]